MLVFTVTLAWLAVDAAAADDDAGCDLFCEVRAVDAKRAVGADSPLIIPGFMVDDDIAAVDEVAAALATVTATAAGVVTGKARAIVTVLLVLLLPLVLLCTLRIGAVDGAGVAGTLIPELVLSPLLG